MGLEIQVAGAGDLSLADICREAGAALMMIDGALVAPDAAPPAVWREARLRTPAGTITVARRPGGVAVVVFGNAGDELQRAQRRIADIIERCIRPR